MAQAQTGPPIIVRSAEERATQPERINLDRRQFSVPDLLKLEFSLLYMFRPCLLISPKSKIELLKFS